jgi:hypothetical protein
MNMDLTGPRSPWIANSTWHGMILDLNTDLDPRDPELGLAR